MTKNAYLHFLLANHDSPIVSTFVGIFFHYLMASNQTDPIFSFFSIRVLRSSMPRSFFNFSVFVTAVSFVVTCMLCEKGLLPFLVTVLTWT